ncbi:MAG TPA: PKD domain-containing protein, partial [Solirubrobacterales bacterium]|nr:PKD domain-containing protein [Solirubrobacterales bacterium]
TYAWDFGDGKHARSSQSIHVHTYSRPGTYTVTLTLTDDEGCSTELVFTGQTASCDGTPAATTSAAIQVVEATGPPLRLKGAKQQRLRGAVSLFARCPREPCAVVASGIVVTTIERGGALRVRRRPLRGASASLAAGSWGRLVLRLPRATRRATSSALRQGGEAEAEVSVVATSGKSGNQRLRRRTVALVLPPHRHHG